MDNPRAPIFAAAGAVVVAILLVVFLVLPKMGQVSTAKEDLAAAQSEQQTLETQKGALRGHAGAGAGEPRDDRRGARRRSRRPPRSPA